MNLRSSQSDSDISDSMSDFSGIYSSLGSLRSECTTELKFADALYLLDGGLSFFVVQGTIYRAHDYFLTRESPVLAARLLEARRTKAPTVLLPEATCSEFESVIDFFYRGMHRDYSPTVEDWIALLSFSTKFGMVKLRARAVTEIDDLHSADAVDPVELLALSKTFDLPAWARCAYTDLAVRPSRMTRDEAARLDSETVADVASVREVWRDLERKIVNAGKEDKRARAGRVVDEVLAFPNGYTKEEGGPAETPVEPSGLSPSLPSLEKHHVPLNDYEALAAAPSERLQSYRSTHGLGGGNTIPLAGALSSIDSATWLSGAMDAVAQQNVDDRRAKAERKKRKKAKKEEKRRKREERAFC